MDTYDILFLECLEREGDQYEGHLVDVSKLPLMLSTTQATLGPMVASQAGHVLTKTTG